MTRQLIINADDFGLTPSVNAGIIETIENGVVRSTSVMANMAAVEEVENLQRRFPAVSIGVHFNLSDGKPVSPPEEVKTLINEKGEFLGDDFVPKLLMGRIRFCDMVRELDNQVKRLVAFGVHPTHFDGHQNKHLYPHFFLAAVRVAQKWDIKLMRSHKRYLVVRSNSRFMRLLRYYLLHPQRAITHSVARALIWHAHMKGIRTADRLITPGYTDSSKKSSLETWLGIMRTLPEGVNEIYCHPGYPDKLLARYASHPNERKVEVAVLTSPELKTAVQKEGIRIVTFRDLL